MLDARWHLPQTSTIYLHLETTFASVENQPRANQEHSRDEVCSGKVESDEVLKNKLQKEMEFSGCLMCLPSVRCNSWSGKRQRFRCQKIGETL